MLYTFKINVNVFNNSINFSAKFLYSNLTKVQEGIIGLIEDRPNITQEEMANLLGVTSRTIRNHIKYLVDNDHIQRIGADKNGKWIVSNKH